MELQFDSFVLAASTAALTDEPAAREHADAIEFRMDLADEPLAALEAYDGELPILATNRAEWEGGEAAAEGRLEALAEATAVDAVGAIDLELESIQDGSAAAVLETARDRDVSIVASAHDFEGTPPREAMVRTLTEAGTDADVAKLAVTAESTADTLALLSVTEQLTARGESVATMAMGDVGSHTRAVAPVYGSKIGYAPVDPADATAPGQYDLETLAGLVTRLG
ncbi:type I 3-dehydroquinate dehydratase [Natrinema pallidum]|uniref:3-dehydroquinate dehydratase n=2 Tax=Natrinema pallidum TaxID=69527 RepID=L9YKN9_9EURY|nr:type I 3-dehydroquinate dehydratase [Natrinema pallidum]ELY74699.1 3-dehydroquinate dehydratase [Natrinema pallidum DSM 3751]QCW04448.1 type I 3-dehydroquinate dehydratase [Natrinema pallidum]